MARLKQESTYDKVRHKYKKTSQGGKNRMTSTMNKHKRRRLKKKIAKK
jgi:hypothetical protein